MNKFTIPITQGRNQLFKIAEEVQNPSIYYNLTENGRSKIVIMSSEEFESWQETLEVMKDFPDLEKDIKKVDEDVKSGEYKKYATLEEVLYLYGYVLADKAKQNYAVSSKDRKKSRKRISKNS